jgi:phage FluMu gp28-like protein
MSEKLRELARADPEAARALLASLRAKIITPHSGGQAEIMADQSRFQIVCCGRRFGKTVVGAKKALKKCRQKDQMVWWVAPTYKVVKRGYREVLRQLPDNVLTHVPPQDSAFDAGRSVVLKFKNGSRMEFYSAERPDGMLGEGVDLVVLDEAATMPKNVWETIVRPTLIDREGQAFMISTPRGRNWFYYLWLRGQDSKQPNYMSWRFPTAANPHLPASEIEEMKATMPLITFQQEVLAEFIASAGSVFRFSAEIIVKTGKPQGHVVVGVDLAKSNDFTVFSAANAGDATPCGYDRFNEVAWAVQRGRLKTFVKQLKKQGATHVTLVMDSTGVGDPIVEEMEADGYDVVGINFTKMKQHMVTQLSKDLEDGTVRLDDEEETAEFENYTYKITDSGRWTYSAPEGQHDDCVAAKMLQHWGIVQEGAPDVTAISASDEDDPEDDEDDEDLSYLYDEPEQDTGLPIITEIEADTTAMIMGRKEAWSGAGSI